MKSILVTFLYKFMLLKFQVKDVKGTTDHVQIVFFASPGPIEA